MFGIFPFYSSIFNQNLSSSTLFLVIDSSINKTQTQMELATPFFFLQETQNQSLGDVASSVSASSRLPLVDSLVVALGSRLGGAFRLRLGS